MISVMSFLQRLPRAYYHDSVISEFPGFMIPGRPLLILGEWMNEADLLEIYNILLYGE